MRASHISHLILLNSGISYLYAGEPNNRGIEECAHYWMRRTNEAEQRGGRAYLHVGLNNLGCDNNIGTQLLICRNELQPINVTTTHSTTGISTRTTITSTVSSTTTEMPASMSTKPQRTSPEFQFSEGGESKREASSSSSCLSECPSALLGSDRLLPVLVAAIGWTLLFCALVYIVLLSTSCKTNSQKQSGNSSGGVGRSTADMSVLSLRALSQRAEERARNRLTRSRASAVSSGPSEDGTTETTLTSTVPLIETLTQRAQLSAPTNSWRSVSTIEPPQRMNRESLLPNTSRPHTDTTLVGRTGGSDNAVGGNRMSNYVQDQPLPPLPATTPEGEDEYGNWPASKKNLDTEQEYSNAIVSEVCPEGENEPDEDIYMNHDLD